MTSSLAPVPELQVVYDSPDVRCVKRTWGSNPELLVVTFTPLEAPGLPHQPFADVLLAQNGINAIHVLSGGNDWFCRPGANRNYQQMIAAVRSQPEFRSAAARVGYGASMGGYSALRFRRALSLHRSVVVAPQYSIDESKVPFETRWRDQAAKSSFEHDHVPPIGSAENVRIVYDPSEREDSAHVELIDPDHCARRVAFPFCSHTALAFFAEVGLVSRLTLGLLRDADVTPLLRLAYERRRTSPLFWRQVAFRWVRMPSKAVWAVDKGLQLSPDNADLRHLRQLYGSWIQG